MNGIRWSDNRSMMSKVVWATHEVMSLVVGLDYEFVSDRFVGLSVWSCLSYIEVIT